MALAAIVSSFVFSASASNVDSEFSGTIANSNTSTVYYTTTPYRKKDNATSAYLKYDSSSGPYNFIALVYGASSSGGSYKDCTTYRIGDNSRRPDAIVTRYTKGYIRQDVREWYGASAWADLRIKYYSGTGTVKGVWSPDSVWESGCIDYN